MCIRDSAAPDSKARLGNELEFARVAHDAGYKSQKNLVFSSKGPHLSHVAHVDFRKEEQVYPYEGLQD